MRRNELSDDQDGPVLPPRPRRPPAHSPGREFRPVARRAANVGDNRDVRGPWPPSSPPAIRHAGAADAGAADPSAADPPGEFRPSQSPAPSASRIFGDNRERVRRRPVRSPTPRSRRPQADGITEAVPQAAAHGDPVTSDQFKRPAG